MVICIVGPTCVGKTLLSVELAKKLNGEIINADSTQVYKGMDIATAKVTEKEKENIPHHLFDIKDIEEEYTIYNYQKDCRNKIKEIENKEKVPILVGGTGLYIKAALYDYDLEEENQIREEYNEITTEELYSELKKIDATTSIHPHNRQRIIRALNYFNNTNKPLSQKKKASKLLYDCILIGLTTDRENLYDRINKRTDEMIKNGLLDEAKKIYDTKIRSKAVLTPIGYKELFPYFNKEISLEEATEKIKKSCRNYAKRQYTFFNHQLNVNWFNVNFDNFNDTINEVIQFIETKKISKEKIEEEK